MQYHICWNSIKHRIYIKLWIHKGHFSTSFHWWPMASLLWLYRWKRLCSKGVRLCKHDSTGWYMRWPQSCWSHPVYLQPIRWPCNTLALSGCLALGWTGGISHSECLAPGYVGTPGKHRQPGDLNSWVITYKLFGRIFTKLCRRYRIPISFTKLL